MKSKEIKFLEDYGLFGNNTLHVDELGQLLNKYSDEQNAALISENTQLKGEQQMLLERINSFLSEPKN